MNKFKYLFGPVPSRRYGRSLGVDLAVPKTCSLNCVFCQLGDTAQTTLEFSDQPPMAAVLDELRAWLAQARGGQIAGGLPDFITAAGSGEPTLHARLDDFFRFVRAESDCRSLLLSNGSLFHLPAVRAAAALADVVKISLHAWDQASFERISRPHKDLKLETVIAGYRAFREMYKGHLDLEVFIVPGVNDADGQVAAIAALARSFAPDGVYLNTAVRPPADGSVKACPPERLLELAAHFGAAAETGGKNLPHAGGTLTLAAVVDLVSRHPMSLEELAASVNRPCSEVLRFVRQYAERGVLSLFEARGETFVRGGDPQSRPQE